MGPGEVKGSESLGVSLIPNAVRGFIKTISARTVVFGRRTVINTSNGSIN